MKLPAREQRWPLAVLLIALALVFASGNVARQDSDDKQQAPKVKAATGQKKDPKQIAGLEIFQGRLEKIGIRTASEKDAIDIFRGKSWYVPPPPPPPLPPPKPEPPPAPVAPPIPYVFMGSYRGDDGKLIIFLTRGDRVYSVSPGDMLEGIYRVEEIVSGRLVLIYTPLNIRQTISIGEVA